MFTLFLKGILHRLFKSYNLHRLFSAVLLFKRLRKYFNFMKMDREAFHSYFA